MVCYNLPSMYSNIVNWRPIPGDPRRVKSVYRYYMGCVVREINDRIYKSKYYYDRRGYSSCSFMKPSDVKRMVPPQWLEYLGFIPSRSRRAFEIRSFVRAKQISSGLALMPFSFIDY